MSSPAWWPASIALNSLEDAFASGEIRTKFGKTSIFDPSPFLQGQHWNEQSSNSWGEWPKEVNKVKLISEDAYGLVLSLDNRWIARISPLGVGEDVSRLARHPEWKEQSQDLVFHTIGGINKDGHDQILLYPQFDLVDRKMLLKSIDSYIATLGKLHTKMSKFATPNAQKIWNDDLKSIEAALNSSTLWRGPHTPVTQGLPRINPCMDVNYKGKSGIKIIAQPRSLVEHLLASSTPLPGVCELMSLERQWANRDEVSKERRKENLEIWKENTPETFWQGRQLSTYLGGPWLWRYRAVLLDLAHARAFGDEELEAKCLEWLNDVSRIQAHMGSLRVIKGAVYLPLSIAIFFAYRSSMGLISDLYATGIVFVLMLIMMGLYNAYWARDPDPY